MNPKQKVPYMQDAGFGLSESAISRYLIARYGSESTMAMPTSVEALAREDEWVSYIYGELDETRCTSCVVTETWRYLRRSPGRHDSFSRIRGKALSRIAEL